jgi:hypothetical protein
MAQRKRIQVNIVLSVQMKETLEKLARESDRSQAHVVVSLIEKALAYDLMFERLNTTPEKLAKQSQAAMFDRIGYRAIRIVHGNEVFVVYVPKAYPLEQSGFIPWGDGPKPEPVEIPPQGPPTTDEIEQARRAVARLDELKAQAEMVLSTLLKGADR